MIFFYSFWFFPILIMGHVSMQVWNVKITEIRAAVAWWWRGIQHYLSHAIMTPSDRLELHVSVKLPNCDITEHVRILHILPSTRNVRWGGNGLAQAAALEKCAKVCRNAVANGAVSARCAQNKRCLLYIPSFLRHDETFLSGCQVQKSGEKEKRKEKKRKGDWRQSTSLLSGLKEGQRMIATFPGHCQTKWAEKWWRLERKVSLPVGQAKLHKLQYLKVPYFTITISRRQVP